jgi:hypothetical protein
MSYTSRNLPISLRFHNLLEYIFKILTNDLWDSIGIYYNILLFNSICLLCFLLLSFAKSLPIFIFSMNKLLIWLILCVDFILHFINFHFDFYFLSMQFFCVWLVLIFSKTLRYIIRLFIWNLSAFLIQTLIAIYFPLSCICCIQRC